MYCNYKHFISDVLHLLTAILYYIQWIVIPQVYLMGRTCITIDTWDNSCILEISAMLAIAALMIFVGFSLLEYMAGKSNSDFTCFGTFILIRKVKFSIVFFVVIVNISVIIIHLTGYTIVNFLLWKNTLTTNDFFTWKTGLAGTGTILMCLLSFGLCFSVYLGCKWCTKRYTNHNKYSKIKESVVSV